MLFGMDTATGLDGSLNIFWYFRSKVKVKKAEKDVFLSHFSSQEVNLGQVGIG